MEIAHEIASTLVEERLAACVQILESGITSIYIWQGKKEISNEFVVNIKTFDERYELVEKVIKSKHPYEVPEIMAISIEKISADYLQWMKSEIK